jgi:signal peptidase I
MAAAAVLLSGMRAFVFTPIYVSSGSMEPTLQRGDFVLVNQLVYSLRPPRRGEIIAFQYPQHEQWDFVKRVVGLPGDQVAARGGQLRVNGSFVAEPYVIAAAADRPFLDLQAGHIPAGQLFVLGDNRGASLDSRFWGTVTERNVIGKASLIYWSQGTHWWDVRWGRIGRWLP